MPDACLGPTVNGDPFRAFGKCRPPIEEPFQVIELDGSFLAKQVQRPLTGVPRSPNLDPGTSTPSTSAS